MATDPVTTTYDIVPTALAVRAMRDNGYKNTAYAVAELMDNSIQAGADRVELLCADQDITVEHRVRRRLNLVAVLDNGSGMDGETLQTALQFGNGSRLDEGKHAGMGRFGMGLPSASISQCRRVDVWTWESGPDSALHSYIDLDSIDQHELRSVPEPENEPVPELWREAADDGTIGESGTIVVWSRIDRSIWRTSLALIHNSEELIGRMYRGWIDAGEVSIRLKSFMEDEPTTPVKAEEARPNDPMYLMERTSCPDPFSTSPMFQPFPNEADSEVHHRIRFHGQEHTIITRFSIATEEAREGANAGALPHGKHAGRNVGISVVRAGRELELDPAWTTTYDPRERWWGVEVRFEPGVDELFGVANNKQSARNFAEAAKIDTQQLIKDHGGSLTAARAALKDDDDPIEPLLEVVHRIQENIRMMRNQIRVQTEGRNRRRHREATVEEQATEAVRKRQQEGHRGQSDEDEKKPADERTASLAEQLQQTGHSETEAQELAAETIDKGLKYRIEVGSLEGGAFFSVQPRGGVLLVTLNTDHPAYELLLGAQEPDDLPDDPERLTEKLQAAQNGLEMMLFAWARYEDEQAGDQRRHAQNVRHDWGRMAENFLESRPTP